jgi:hypothetical protein
MDASGTNEDIRLVANRRGTEERRKVSSDEKIGTREERDLKSTEHQDEGSEPVGTSFISKTNCESFQTDELIRGQIQPTERVGFGEAIGNRRNDEEDNISVSNAHSLKTLGTIQEQETTHSRRQPFGQRRF